MRRRRRRPTSTPFRRWVRATQRCLTCGAALPDPHHVKAKGMGGVKDENAVDVENVVPLCRTCHNLGESPGWSWKRFEAHFRVDLKREAVRTWRRWTLCETKHYYEDRDLAH